MKLLSLAVTLGAVVLSAASSADEVLARRAGAEADAHRMLRKRAANAASGPGQGAVQFAALQNAIIARSPLLPVAAGGAALAAAPKPATPKPAGAKKPHRKHHTKKPKAKKPKGACALSRASRAR